MEYVNSARCLLSSLIACAGWLPVAILFVPMPAGAQSTAHIDVLVSLQDESRIEITEIWDVDVGPEGQPNPLEKSFHLMQGTNSDLVIEAVTRDGDPQPWEFSSSSVDSIVEIVIGNAGHSAATPGRHQYKFHYWINVPLQDHFHFYIPGADSSFDLDRDTTGTLAIIGPPHMYVDIAAWSLEEIAAKTGHPVEVELTNAGTSQHAEFSLIRKLGSTGGFFVFANFRPGFVGDGSGPSHIYRSFFPLDGPLLPILVLLIIAYYVLAILWVRSRKLDPVAAGQRPLSPAAMRFLSLGRFDSITVAVAFLDLTRREFIEIRTLGDGTQEARRTAGRDRAALEFDDERRLLETLFPAGIDTVPLVHTRAKHFKSVVKTYEASLFRQFKLPDPWGRRFLWVSGIAIPTIGMMIASELFETHGNSLFMFSLAFYWIFLAAWQLWDHRQRRRQHVATEPSSWLYITMLLVFAAFFLKDLPDALRMLGYSVPLIFTLVLVFSIWLAKELFLPVRAAPWAAHQIETMRETLCGFLDTRERSNAPTLPDELIPYAVALDRGGRWLGKIADRVRRLLGHDPASSLTPWYLNQDVGLISFGNLAPVLQAGRLPPKEDLATVTRPAAASKV